MILIRVCTFERLELPERHAAIYSLSGLSLNSPKNLSSSIQKISGAIPLSSALAAVINAIYNACGVRIYELPASPDKVKAGLDVIAAGGTVGTPSPYYLGPDYFAAVEDMEPDARLYNVIPAKE